MPTPSNSVSFWAVPYGTSTIVAIGNVMLPDTTGGWVVSTAANRTAIGRRSEGVAVTNYGGSGLGTVEIWQTGTLDATVSGLAVGSASWVRCSTTGTIERCTPSGSDDIIGYAEADGRVHLAFGTWTAAIINASGGSGFTAGGDLSGTSSSQSVDKVKATVIGTAGGALSTGAVLRVTGVSAADWGAVNLASTNAVTGLLPLVNITPSGTNSWVLTTVGGAVVWQASAGGGANPAGSGSEIQYRVNGTTFGAVSGASSNGTKIDFSADPTWTKSAQVGTLAWTPTATRTMTVPDATDTFVGKATTDTLTNKTYSLSGTGNVLNDTSIAQYDLVMANATPAFKRFAKGSASTVLTTSSGSVVQWAQVALGSMVTGTLPLANFTPGSNGNYLATTGGVPTWQSIAASDINGIPGSSGQPLYNNGGAIGAASNWSIGTGLTGGTSSFLALLGGTVSTAGAIRLPYVATDTVIGAKDSGGTDRTILSRNSADYWVLGTYGVFNLDINAVNVNVQVTNALNLYSQAAVTIALGSTAAFGKPVGGNGVPFQWAKATISVSTGTVTLSTAQASCPYLDFSSSFGSGTANIIAPDVVGSHFFLRNATNSATLMNFKKSGGTGITVSTNKNASTIHNGTDYCRMSADSVDT